MAEQKKYLTKGDICDLAKLALPKSSRKLVPNAIRPERPALFPHDKKFKTTPELWESTAFQTQAEKAFKKALGILLRGMGGSVVNFVVDRLMSQQLNQRPGNISEFRPIITSTAAILWDIQSRPSAEVAISQARDATPSPVRYGFLPLVSSHNPMLSPLIEHMLLVDYGIGECPLRKPRFTRSSKIRRYLTPALYQLGENLSDIANGCGETQVPIFSQWDARNEHLTSAKLGRCGDIGDVALMLYYFHTHRRAITTDEFNNGLTGYTGVIAEMVAEIPNVGADRLLRKLSVDLNIMIPKHVRDPGRVARMTDVVESTARENGILHLLNPESRANGSVEPAGAVEPTTTTTETSSRVPPPPPYVKPPSYPKPPNYGCHTYDELISESPDSSRDSRSTGFVPMMNQFRGWM